MQKTSPDHASILGTIAGEFAGLLQSSEQPIYLYLDDHHKVCNERFAKLLGYGSAKAWADVDKPFPPTFVEAGSHPRLIGAFQAAMEKGVGASFPVTWKKKDGKTVPSTCILVPIDVQGHRVALHFISPT